MLRAALRQQLRGSSAVQERLEHLMDAPPSWVHKLHITRDMLDRSGPELVLPLSEPRRVGPAWMPARP